MKCGDEYEEENETITDPPDQKISLNPDLDLVHQNVNHQPPEVSCIRVRSEYCKTESTSFKEYGCQETVVEQSSQPGSNNSECEQTNSTLTLRYKCKECHYESKHRKNLAKHVIARHTKPEDIKWANCEQCPYKAKDRASLKRHMLSKHTKAEDVQWNKCEQCPFKTKYRHSLRIHIDLKHNTQWFECNQCRYKVKNKWRLESHILTKHSDPEYVKWFRCEHCPYTSIVKTSLENHVVARHKIVKECIVKREPITEPIANNDPTQAAGCYFVCELSSLEKFECCFCDFKSDLKLAAERHTNLVHQKVDYRQPEVQLRYYECHKCKYKTYSILVFTRHLCSKCCNARNTYGDRETGELPNSKPAVWYKCVKCQYGTRRKVNLKRHTVVRHTNPEDIKWFECAHCHYKVQDRRTLREHMLLKHEAGNVKWYKCDVCPFKTKYGNSLRQHFINRHNTDNVKWFACDYCPYKVKHNETLKRHIHTKHGHPKF